MHEPISSDETLDSLCNERVRLIQKKKAYRFSIDPLLLANFVKLKKYESLLDVGTGCGIIPIYMAKRGYVNKLVGIEVQDDLYGLAVRNKQLNACSNAHFVKGDVKTSGRELGHFHVLVSNPPYVRERTGRKSPGTSRLIARHESALDLGSLVSIASSLLETGGRLYLIYPAKRLAEVIHETKSAGLEPKRLRLVHSRPGEQATLSLIECMKGGGVDLKVEAPLYVYVNNDYSEEVSSYYV
jgi:tRNA1Val (adenine37-N6)-methyltransferase